MTDLEKQLIFAALRGNLDEVKRLHRAGADIHADNDLALYRAARNGHLQVVDYLIDNGADWKVLSVEQQIYILNQQSKNCG